MIKTGFIVAAMLLSSTVFAMAQQATPPQDNDMPGMMMPPGHGGMGQSPDGGQWGGGQWGGGQWGGGQWGSHHPMMMQMMRMMNRNPHFEINLGRGAGVRIDCGRDTVRDCVEATLPLLDRANAMLDKMPKMPPPPPKPAGTNP